MLADRGLAYLHLVEPRGDGTGTDIRTSVDQPTAAAQFRPYWPEKLITAGGFDQHSAEAVVATGDADAVAFGRSFLANPDLPARFAAGAALNPYDRSTSTRAATSATPTIPRSATPTGSHNNFLRGLP